MKGIDEGLARRTAEGHWNRGITPSSDEAAIRLDGVTKRFGDNEAVRDMTLSIGRGEFFSLLGPSGCGKTTTLRMVAGFEQPSVGRIFLEGQPVEKVPPYRRNVNTVFQSYALFEHLDVTENIAFGLKRRRVPRDEIRRRVTEMLELVRLVGREHAKPRELSGGQRQRVALARALVNRPAVLLLDEPLGALDLKLRRRMQIELSQIQREVGITFVYVTHDQEEALAMSDRVAVIREGAVMQCGAPEEVYERPAGEFVADFIGISNLVEGTVRDRDRVAIATGNVVPAPLPEGFVEGEVVRIAVRPEKVALDALEPGMVALEGTIVQRVYQGMTTQLTISLGGGAQLVALEQNTYMARSDDRWEPGTSVKVGWHPEHCIVLR